MKFSTSSFCLLCNETLALNDQISQFCKICKRHIPHMIKYGSLNLRYVDLHSYFNVSPLLKIVSFIYCSLHGNKEQVTWLYSMINVLIKICKIYFMSLLLKIDIHIMLISTLRIERTVKAAKWSRKGSFSISTFVSFILHNLCFETFLWLKVNNYVQ